MWKGNGNAITFFYEKTLKFTSSERHSDDGYQQNSLPQVQGPVKSNST